jgi:hypothetical protein
MSLSSSASQSAEIELGGPAASIHEFETLKESFMSQGAAGTGKRLQGENYFKTAFLEGISKFSIMKKNVSYQYSDCGESDAFFCTKNDHPYGFRNNSFSYSEKSTLLQCHDDIGQL